MADNDVTGQFEAILHVGQGEDWRQVWESLGLLVLTFENIGLPRTAPDLTVWQTCQDLQIALLTANRRSREPESLEATIRSRNQATSLPVFTISDAGRVFKDGGYATRVAVRFLQYLMDIDKVRGTGRLYLP